MSNRAVMRPWQKARESPNVAMQTFSRSILAAVVSACGALGLPARAQQKNLFIHAS